MYVFFYKSFKYGVICFVVVYWLIDFLCNLYMVSYVLVDFLKMFDRLVEFWLFISVCWLIFRKKMKCLNVEWLIIDKKIVCRWLDDD